MSVLKAKYHWPLIVMAVMLAMTPVPLLGFEPEPPPEIRAPALIEPAPGTPTSALEQAMFADAARGQYAEAVVKAQQHIAALTRSNMTTPVQLSLAYTNLGTLQYRTDDFEAAIISYRAAIDALGGGDNFRDPRLADPLFGLGVSQTAAGHHADAIDTLRRAIFIARADSGLQSPHQLRHDNALMQSLLVTGKVDEALDRQKVRVTIMSQALGKTPELIPTIDEAARWYRALQEYELEAETVKEKVEILEQVHGDEAIEVVAAWRELAQAYDRFIGSDVDKLRLLLRRDDTAITATSRGVFMTRGMPRRPFEEIDEPTPRERRILDYERYALTYLKKSLRIQEDHPDTPPAELALTETLIGDHYQATGKYRSARTYYKRAHKRLRAAGDTATIEQLFGAPTPLYRKAMRPPRSDDPTVLRAYSGTATLTMRVLKTGKATDVELVSVEPDEARMLASKIERNARKTVFRPRVTERGPVDTDPVTLKYPLVPAPSR